MKNPFEPRADLKVYIDGKIVPVAEAKISVFDHGLLYGDGVFEGIRVYDGKIFEEEAHIVRLFQSARAIRLEIPLSPAEVSKAMYDTMKANGITGDGYIRLVVTRGVGTLGINPFNAACPSVIIIADQIALYPPAVYEKGLEAVTASMIRNHPNAMPPRIKSLNYLNNILAKIEAVQAGVPEAVMLNHLGLVAECTGDNIFIWRTGQLLTPPLYAGILDGITRAVVMKLAKRRNLSVVETDLMRHDLYIADELFVTGSAAQIVPIVKVDGRVVGDGKCGPITRQLIDDFEKYKRGKLM
jgi:branched-chain amino acid aminotransferase